MEDIDRMMADEFMSRSEEKRVTALRAAKITKTPPDPEGMNDKRAEAAHNMINPQVRQRRIVKSLVKEFLAQGLTLCVDHEGHRSAITNDSRQILDLLMKNNEDWLIVYDPKQPAGQRTIGSILLVYGNNGWNVMNAWSTTLDPFMPQTLKLTESLRYKKR